MLAALGPQIALSDKSSLIHAGEPAQQVFNLITGTVRLYKLLPDGRRQVVGFALPGDFLGLADFLGRVTPPLPTPSFASLPFASPPLSSAHLPASGRVPAPVASFSADAIGPVTACMFAREHYAALVEAKPHLLRQLFQFAAQELAMAQEQMVILGRRNAEEKLVCFLLRLQERWGRLAGGPSVTVPLPMSRQDIADFLGLTIETVSRTFSKLAREKSILIVADGVRLLNPERLARIAAS